MKKLTPNTPAAVTLFNVLCDNGTPPHVAKDYVLNLSKLYIAESTIQRLERRIAELEASK